MKKKVVVLICLTVLLFISNNVFFLVNSIKIFETAVFAESYSDLLNVNKKVYDKFYNYNLHKQGKVIDKYFEIIPIFAINNIFTTGYVFVRYTYYIVGDDKVKPRAPWAEYPPFTSNGMKKFRKKYDGNIGAGSSGIIAKLKFVKHDTNWVLEEIIEKP